MYVCPCDYLAWGRESLSICFCLPICLYFLQYVSSSPRSGAYCELLINVLILALENEFLEIIYIQFGGMQNIFSIIFDIKFAVICAAKILKIGLGFYIGKGDNQ